MKKYIFTVVLTLFFVVQAYAEITYELYDRSGNAVTCPAITEANMGSDELCAKGNNGAPWPIRMFSVDSDGSLHGLSVTLESTQIHDDQVYLKLDSAGANPNQFQMIPLSFRFRPCYTAAAGQPFPDFLDLPPNQPVSVSFYYGSNLSCSPADPWNSIYGRFEVTRLALAQIPEDGTYTGDFTIVLGPEGG